MFCKYCGNKVDDGDVFCGECGGYLHSKLNEVDSKKKKNHEVYKRFLDLLKNRRFKISVCILCVLVLVGYGCNWIITEIVCRKHVQIEEYVANYVPKECVTGVSYGRVLNDLFDNVYFDYTKKIDYDTYYTMVGDEYTEIPIPTGRGNKIVYAFCVSKNSEGEIEGWKKYYFLCDKDGEVVCLGQESDKVRTKGCLYAGEDSLLPVMNSDILDRRIVGQNYEVVISSLEEDGYEVKDGLAAESGFGIDLSVSERRKMWFENIEKYKVDISDDVSVYVAYSGSEQGEEIPIIWVLLFVEKDVVVAYHVLLEIDVITVGECIDNSELYEVSALQNEPQVDRLLGKDSNGVNWDDVYTGRLIYSENGYSVQLHVLKYDFFEDKVISNINNMQVVDFYVEREVIDKNGLSKVPEKTTPENNPEGSGAVEIDSNVAAAGKMFEDFLGGKAEMEYDDASCSGMILICKEQPSEDNNEAQYSIAGRGFSPFYDSDCIDVIGDTYVFYNGREFGGIYYKIDIVERKMFIYWSDSLDMGYFELCGQIGESKESLNVDNAREKAKLFLESIVGQYYDMTFGGMITVREEEPYGFNNYANYAIEGPGFTTLYDMYCSDVIGNEYYFELYDSCYKIEDNFDKGYVAIYYGSSKETCNKMCGMIGRDETTTSDVGEYVSQKTESSNEKESTEWDTRVEVGMSQSEVDDLWGGHVQEEYKHYSDGDLIYRWYFDMYDNYRMVIYNEYNRVELVFGDDLFE